MTIEADGFQLTEGAPSAEISGIQFVRADFVKGAVHETILAGPTLVTLLFSFLPAPSANRTGQLDCID